VVESGVGGGWVWGGGGEGFVKPPMIQRLVELVIYVFLAR